MPFKAHAIEGPAGANPSLDLAERMRATLKLIDLTGEDIAAAYQQIEDNGGRIVGEHILPIPESGESGPGYLGRSVLYLVAKYPDE